MATVRLLPFEVADGPCNMATDEVLVNTAAEQHIASLRFYGWSPATLSLGYFQPSRDRLSDLRLASLPWVRRPSGGATLVHDREVTYALALPSGTKWQQGEPWMTRMHRIIAAGLAALGAAGHLALAEQPNRTDVVLCFQQVTPGDLLCDGQKIVGSAQRKHHRCLLQHGGILLAQSRHAPQLPGLCELLGFALEPQQIGAAVAAAFTQMTGWPLDPGDWTNEERRQITQLVDKKYNSPAWNEKR